MTLHHRQMKRIPRGQARITQHDSLCPFEVGQLNREDLIDDSQECIEGRLDRVAAVDGDVPVKDLLERFDVRNETLSFGKAPFQDLLSITLVRVRRPHEVHRNVRIDEDHRGESR
jgi:hypothetical protein